MATQMSRGSSTTGSVSSELIVDEMSSAEQFIAPWTGQSEL